MEKAYKFRVYPNTSQEVLIQKTFGCTRYVYNYYLAKRMEVYDKDKTTFNYYSCSADMTSLKKEALWLKEADSTALQSSLKDLDSAYQNFFRRVKEGVKPGYPKFKSKKNNHQSYTTKFSNGNIAVLDNHIKLPKLGLVKCRVSKQVQHRILFATVSQNPSGKYFVSVVCTDVKVESIEKTGAMVGIDLGLKELVITSDGQHFPNSKCYIRSQNKVAKLQRELSRKSSGSNNREKARIKAARQYEHITNQRLDGMHKMTIVLVNNYDLISIETLSPKNMVKNHKLAKAISDAAWGEIVRQMEYKCDWYGKKLVKVDRFYPSSQICNHCGFKNVDTKNLSVRKWDCPQCNTHHDRDINAAKNILDEGLRIISAA